MRGAYVNERERLQRLRHTGTHGTRIVMHRALRSITLSPLTLATILLLPVLCDGLLWVGLDRILDSWGSIFHFWLGKLQLDTKVSYAGMSFFGRELAMPYPDFDVGLPSRGMTYLNAVICAILLVLSRFISKRYLPLVYLLRAALIIQFSSSVYYWFQPVHLPYSLVSYMTGMLALGLYLCFFSAPLLAMIYYIFDIPLWRKVSVTLGLILYLLLVIPNQYLFHAVIISEVNALFLPVLYLLFGALLNVLMFVSLYAWAMASSSDDR